MGSWRFDLGNWMTAGGDRSSSSSSASCTLRCATTCSLLSLVRLNSPCVLFLLKLRIVIPLNDCRHQTRRLDCVQRSFPHSKVVLRRPPILKFNTFVICHFHQATLFPQFNSNLGNALINAKEEWNDFLSAHFKQRQVACDMGRARKGKIGGAKSERGDERMEK